MSKNEYICPACGLDWSDQPWYFSHHLEIHRPPINLRALRDITEPPAPPATNKTAVKPLTKG